MPTALPVINERRRSSEGSRAPLVEPDLSTDRAGELAGLAKALADPTRLLIVDALRKAAPEALCQCELLPLFKISQAAIAKHLKVLVDAEIVGLERRGVWAYYYLVPGTLEGLCGWMT